MPSNVYHASVQLTRSQARRLLEGAVEKAREFDLPPLTLVVLDAGGHLIAAEREDGCGPLRFPVAKGKAFAALGMGIASGVIGERNQERTAFLASVAAASQGQVVPVAGGVPILDDRQCVIGAVGVSGASSEEDQQVAIAGIEAAQLDYGLAP
ncbi:GlcG/HbpS family heme-binding protein [Vreelandella malpeensis]|uniref:Heme-binding protein n=1 Tax=Vreelandella malpeensis TaxID=1172368 RepID=A0ABS8DP13_9GAMM|nr:heme-binding protein [Halomonas malpeensis]MCB8888010.1 heme-binding protein [Halomonas malpeensis]